MADKLMYIPNDDTQSYPFCILIVFESLKPLKSLKLLSQQIRKRYYKTLVTSVINSPIYPPPLLDNNILSKLSLIIFPYSHKNIHFSLCQGIYGKKGKTY